MYVIFLFPLVMSLAAAAMIALGDYGPVSKAIAVLLAIAAATMQLVPALQSSVHFLIPLFMQLILCGWWYIASHFE